MNQTAANRTSDMHHRLSHMEKDYTDHTAAINAANQPEEEQLGPRDTYRSMLGSAIKTANQPETVNAPVHTIWCSCHLCQEWRDRQREAINAANQPLGWEAAPQWAKDAKEQDAEAEADLDDFNTRLRDMRVDEIAPHQGDFTGASLSIAAALACQGTKHEAETAANLLKNAGDYLWNDMRNPNVTNQQVTDMGQAVDLMDDLRDQMTNDTRPTYEQTAR